MQKTYNKLNFEIEKFSDKFSNILVSKNKTVANDGRVLVEMSVPENNKPIEDFPLIEGFTPSNTIEDFCLPKDIAKKIAKSMPNSKKHPQINCAAIEQKENDTTIAFTDLVSPTKIQVKNSGEKYPDYEKVFPTQQPAVKFMVNAKMLKDLCDIACKLSDTETIQFDVIDGDMAIVLHAGNVATGQKMRALLMPCRIRE